MATTRRALPALAAACLVVPIGSAAAQAPAGATLTEQAGTGAYFWAGKLPSTLTLGPLSQPNPVNGQDTDLDGVARDELAVAVLVPGRTDKESFLAWDLFDLGAEDVITSFVVTSPVSTTPPGPDGVSSTIQFGTQAGVELQACAPKGSFGADDAGAYENKPEVDRTKCVPGTVDAAGANWTFDVTSLSTEWLTTSNNGIAIVPTDAQLLRPFQLVFQPAEAHTAVVTYTPGPDSDDEPSALGELLVGGGSAFDGGGSLDTTSFAGGSFGGTGTGTGSGSLSPLLGGSLDGAAEPATADPAVASGPVRTEAVALVDVPSGPPLGFWLVALLLGLALLGLSRASGAAPVLAAAPRQGSVLSKVTGARSAT